MDCPRCGSAVAPPAPGAMTSCNQCGWGRDRPAPVEIGPTFDGSPPARGAMLSLLVLLSAALLVGPWYGISHYLGAQLPENWPLYYIGFAALYLAICWTFTPSPDMENLGWFGGLRDNPFSYEDDTNRFLLLLALLMLPGKLVVYTVFSFVMLWRG